MASKFRTEADMTKIYRRQKEKSKGRNDSRCLRAMMKASDEYNDIPVRIKLRSY